jgi:hypothetical protein
MYHHPKGSDLYMGFNDLVWSMFQGYKAEKDKRDPYKELEKSWYLYEVKDLKT